MKAEELEIYIKGAEREFNQGFISKTQFNNEYFETSGKITFESEIKKLGWLRLIQMKSDLERMIIITF